MTPSVEAWATLALVLGAAVAVVVRIALSFRRPAPRPPRTPREEFEQLRAEQARPRDVYDRGMHIIEGELTPCTVEELRAAGWVDAPYLDVSGGRVREVRAADLGYVDGDGRPVEGVVRFEPISMLYGIPPVPRDHPPQTD